MTGSHARVGPSLMKECHVRGFVFSNSKSLDFHNPKFPRTAIFHFDNWTCMGIALVTMAFINLICAHDV